MKKLIMMLAAVCAVGIAQAAYVNWAINLGKEDYASKQYYVFAGSQQSTVLGLLGAFDADTATTLDGLALASGTLNAKAGKASGNSLDVGTANSLFMLVLNDTLADGKTYVDGLMDISTLTYAPPDSAPGTFTAYIADFSGSGTIAAAGGSTPTPDVPEPTSGLLMLVGFGALALRRRRA